MLPYLLCCYPLLLSHTKVIGSATHLSEKKAILSSHRHEMLVSFIVGPDWSIPLGRHSGIFLLPFMFYHWTRAVLMPQEINTLISICQLIDLSLPSLQLIGEQSWSRVLEKVWRMSSWVEWWNFRVWLWGPAVGLRDLLSCWVICKA